MKMIKIKLIMFGFTFRLIGMRNQHNSKIKTNNKNKNETRIKSKNVYYNTEILPVLEHKSKLFAYTGRRFIIIKLDFVKFL